MGVGENIERRNVGEVSPMAFIPIDRTVPECRRLLAFSPIPNPMTRMSAMTPKFSSRRFASVCSFKLIPMCRSGASSRNFSSAYSAYVTLEARHRVRTEAPCYAAGNTGLSANTGRRVASAASGGSA